MDKEPIDPLRRVLICGTRDGLHDDGVILLRQRLHELSLCVVIEGGARGVDRQARDLAQAIGLTVETYPAHWDKYGRRAGSIRNQEMLDSGIHLVIAFPGLESRGTWDMVRRAEKAGVPVEVHRVG